MGIFKMHKAILILPFIVAGLKHAQGNPDPNPLVSSSGMMPMNPKKEPSPNITSADSGSKPFSIMRPIPPDGRISVVSKQENTKNIPEPEKAVQPTLNPQIPGIFKSTLAIPPPQLPKEIIQQEVENKRKAEVLEKVIISESLKEIDSNNQSVLELQSKPSAGGKRQLKPGDEEDEVFFETLKNDFEDDGKPKDATAGDTGGGDGSPSQGEGELNSVFRSLNVGFDEESNYTSGGGGDDSDGGQVGGGGGDNEVEVGADPFNEDMDIGINMTQEVSSNLEDDPLPYGRYLTFKLGPPWEDPLVIGSLVEQAVVEPVEISFRAAERLCQAMRQTYKGSKKPLHYYLWAPINQYVPMTHKAFPIRPPVFSPECLKWVLRPCRGEVRRPLLKPCTYWAPMRIRRPECGYVQKQEYKMVNYRTPMFIPGNCPCVWPCTRRFDHIQRCRVKVEKHEQKMERIDIAGDPALDTELKIQENYAYQLCRSMRLALSSNTLLPIGWIPIRVENLKPNQQITSGRNYYGISKRETGNETSKVIPKIKRKILKDKRKHKRGHHHHHHKHQYHRHHHQYEELKKQTEVDELELGQNVLQRKKRDIDNGIDENGDGEEGVLFISFDAETHNDDPDGSENDDGNGGGSRSGSNGGNGNNAGYVGERCPVWHYKSCGRSLPPEDLVSAEGDHEKPGTSIETDSVEYEEDQYMRRKRRVRREEEDVDPSVAASLSFSFDEERSYKEGEGSFEIEDSIESGISSGGGEAGGAGGSGSSSTKNSSDATGGRAKEICNEWYVVEEDCVAETPVAVTKYTAGRNAFDDKEVVKDICPGGGDFPCFLKRKKRDSSKDALLRGHENGFKPYATHNSSVPFKKHEKEKQHKKRTKRSEESVSEESSSHSRSIEDDDYDSYESHLRRQKKSEMDSRKLFVNKIRFRKDTSCRCDWPCLPFYDSINKCYDDNGRLLVNSAGKPVVIHRSYRKYQRDPVVCINFADSDEIYCKIKSYPVRSSMRNIVPYE